MDIQAAKTVAMTVLAYLVCYIPFILFTRFGYLNSNASRAGWPGFLAQFCIFVSSGINPVIYCFRTRRFRSALVQFLKDPCGRSPIQEPRKEQMAQSNMADRMTREAVGINNITYHVGDPCVTPRSRFANPQRESGVQRYEGEKYNEKEGQSSLSGKVIKEAWVKKHQTFQASAAGGSYSEESPHLSEAIQLKEVPVEVYHDRKI